MSEPRDLFACLRLTEKDRDVVAIAREFSPRIQRHGTGCVVLDVSGLEHLLGDPHAIGAELARASSQLLEPAVTLRDLSAPAIGHRSPVAGPRYRGIYAHPREHAALCFDRFHPDDANIRDNPRLHDDSQAAVRGSPSVACGSANEIRGIREHPRPVEDTRGIREHPRPVEEIRANPRPAKDIGELRVAVAGTQIATLLLALANPGLSVVIGDPAPALAALPVEVLHQWLAEQHGITFLRGKTTRSASCDSKLQIENCQQPAQTSTWTAWPAWEVCEYAFDVLHRWGIRTLREFAALPVDELSARMGQDGLALQRLARGIDSRPLVPDPDVPRFLERLVLEWPVDGLEPLSFVLARLLDPLSLALERADRGAAAIRLALRLVDRTTHRRVLQLPAPMRDARVLRTLLLLDLESHPPSAGIDIVTIEVDPAPGRILQYSLLERATPSAEIVATLTARLGALIGTSRCGTPVLLDTHRPDGFRMEAFQVRGSAPAARRASEARRAERVGVGPHEQEEKMPGLASSVLRRFRPPVAVRVTVARGRPVRVAIDRRGMPGGEVVQAAGPWRSSGAWWDRGSTDWDRDEWDVALSDGAICRLCRECHTGLWWMEAVVD
jgi:protein ImuB